MRVMTLFFSVLALLTSLFTVWQNTNAIKINTISLIRQEQAIAETNFRNIVLGYKKRLVHVQGYAEGIQYICTLYNKGLLGSAAQKFIRDHYTFKINVLFVFYDQDKGTIEIPELEKVGLPKLSVPVSDKFFEIINKCVKNLKNDSLN